MNWSTIFSSSHFDEVREKLDTTDYARAIFENLKSGVDKLMEKPVDIPLVGGGWSHNYNCPEDGARLREIDLHHHQCPVCGKIWSGSPWDETAIGKIHGEYGTSCKNAAVAFGITGKQEYADWVRRILMYYAENYDRFAFHDRVGGTAKHGGKVQCQTLSEASWILPLAQGCYILRLHNAIPQQELNFIKEKLFAPFVMLVNGNPCGISNWQTYHNAAKAWVAAASDDRALMEEVIHDPENGFVFQMSNSLGDDGFWYEGAWGYHFYDLQAQTSLVQAALTFEIPLQENKRFRSMFLAPLNCQFPDHSLPPVHDSDTVNLLQYSSLYEISYAFWEIGREVLEATGRDSLNSLLYGKILREGTKPQEKQEQFTVTDLQLAGMLFVKQMDEKGKPSQAAVVDYGQHGGYHGHQDKLNILYYTGGHPWITDAGMLPYGNAMHKAWFKQSIAHNTLVIGGRSQNSAEGKLTGVHASGNMLELQAEVDTAYPGVSLNRKVILTPQVLIDICEVTCEEEQDIDWVIHTQGFLSQEECRNIAFENRNEDMLGQQDGYQFLREVKKAGIMENQWRLQWSWNPDEKGRDCFQAYGLEEEEALQMYVAESPAMPFIKRRSTLIRRKRASKHARFITAFRSTLESEGELKLEKGISEQGKETVTVIIGWQVHHTLEI